MKIALVLGCLLILSGCGSAQHGSNAAYMNSNSYKDRKSLTESLFNSKGPALTEASIKKILSSKIAIPRKARIGVIKLESKTQYSTGMRWQQPSSLMNNKAFILNESLANEFFGKIKESKRVRDIVILPSMMIPKPVTVNGLRESAVRLQVDLLLVLKSESLADYEFMPFFVKDKAKTLSTVEAVLLDVRTGVIPFTAVTTDTASIREGKGDLNHHDLMKRSSELAETKALSKTAMILRDFLKQLK